MVRQALAGLLVVLAAFAAAPSAPAAAGDTPPPLPFSKLFGGPFELTDHTGNVRTDRDFHGRFALIYFGYTWCPDICPASLQEMTAALEELGGLRGRVQPLFVSIDPERDTPDILADYVAQFGGGVIGLSGSEAATARLAKAYRLHRVRVKPEWAEGDDEYLVDHSSNTFLVGPDGKVLTLFPHNTPAGVMAMRIRTYLAHPPEG